MQAEADVKDVAANDMVGVMVETLDSITTKEDTISALEDALGGDAARCRVTSIRSTYGESQNATVMADIDVAQLLLKKGTLLSKRIDNADVLLTAACNQSMPRRANTSRRGPVYWWTQKIGELRRECIEASLAYTKKNFQHTSEKFEV
nr:unnamed protein product [Callosobruchus analis]